MPNNYAQIKKNYDRMTKFFTPKRLTALQSIDDRIQRISDGPDHLGVDIGYYCAAGEVCDPARVQQMVMGSVDSTYPDFASALAAHGVPNKIKVVIEHERYRAN